MGDVEQAKQLRLKEQTALESNAEFKGWYKKLGL